MRILVIEDDPAISDMLVMVLEVEGFDVAVAHDGQAGLEMARRARPDVVLLDVMLPNMHGWEVAEALQADPELSSVPVVFCTSKADANSTWRGWQLGAASYVTKPFDNEALICELLRVTRPTDGPGAGHAPERDPLRAGR